MKISDYLEDWEDFRKYIEKKAKGRCVINNKNWMKLRDYHFDRFLKNIEYPFGFIFRILYMTKIHKDIPCIHKMYNRYKKREVQRIDASKMRPRTRADAFKKYR